MAQGLRDRVAVVTGGGSGIGRAICLGFAREGARVVVVSNVEPEAESVAADVRALGTDGTARVVDVTDAARVRALADELSRTFGSADILVTITSAREPVLKGEWIGTGVHVNAAGSNSLIRREIDEETVRRMSRIVTDDLEQAKIEGGDLLPSVERGQIHWGQVHGLAEVVAGYYPGRADVEENTLFNSLGLAAEDIAAAAVVYEKAVAQGIGERVPMFE